MDFIRCNSVGVIGFSLIFFFFGRIGFSLIVANIRPFLSFNYNFEVKFIHRQTNMMSMV